MPALAAEKPATILVTGATGYIASHVVLAALQSFPNYKVRGTVRAEEKAKDLRAALSKQGVDTSDSHLEFAYVDDLLSEHQIGKAMVGVHGVAHIALPNISENLVEDATASVLTVLKCAQKAGTVQRVVITSSSCASVSMPCSPRDGFVDAGTWNDSAIERWRNYKALSEEERTAIKRRTDGSWFWYLYEACKTVSEKEAWKWMEKNKPEFDLVTVLPNANFGPVIYGEVSSTAEWIAMLLKNTERAVEATQSIASQWHVDVRDDAKVHLLSLSAPEVANKRLWTVSDPWGWNDILAILRNHFPGTPVPSDVDDPDKGPTCQMHVEHALATKLVGSWIGLEKSVVDTAMSIGY
ncbi:NAD(P)-binding protein [Calocera viscosa TUFC12733]|uniref:NAD(P)-binding protein n=1 Tax=Calocera viscosa (strain TUFC12733) TaxID=1330018 RepID=A0A167MI95_CALVF|nr:NAD(P)-binding protein [Calocera viscosa TUFC12733]